MSPSLQLGLAWLEPSQLWLARVEKFQLELISNSYRAPDFQTFHHVFDKGTIRLCKWFGFIVKPFSCSWKLWLQANYPSFCSCWGPPPHFSSYFNVALILKEPIKNRRALICLWSFAHFIVVNYNVCLNCVCVPWILSKQIWRAKVVAYYFWSVFILHIMFPTLKHVWISVPECDFCSNNSNMFDSNIKLCQHTVMIKVK